MQETLKGRNVRVRDGQWHYRFNFRGKEYSGPTGLNGDASNQSAAEAFADERRRELEQSRRPQKLQGAPKGAIALNTGFCAQADVFLAWCKDTEYKAKPNTAARLKTSFVSLMKFFGNISVRQIDAEAIERYKTLRLGMVRDITVRHDLHALSVFFRKFACKRGLAASNPVKLVSVPSDRDAIQEHVVTPAEEKAYFGAAASMFETYRKSFKSAQPTLADVARLILEQGCRPEEILALRKEHISLDAGTLRIAGGKTRAARRTLHLTAPSMEIFRRRLAASGTSPWLFPSDRNPGHHITKLDNAHDRICLDAAVSFRLYDFRHTFATRAIEAGVQIAVVAAILGHSGLRTIHRYVHPTDDAQRAGMAKLEAANAERRAV